MDKNTFNIRDLEILSGIKSHTIRIWEQRYALLAPKRTNTNIRYYCDEDLKYLLQVALLNNKGIRISKIAKMSKREIRTAYTTTILSDKSPHPQISGLVSSMIEMNERLFTEVYNKNVAESGMRKTIINIIYPFLCRIGMLWVTDKIKPIQEHFILNLIRQKLIAAIDALPFQTENSSKCLLFMPEKEYHEIGLLLASFLLKESGYDVCYAGANMPIDNVKVAANVSNLDFAITIMTIYPAKNKLQAYVEKVGNILGDIPLFISGYQSSFIANPPANVKIWKGVNDLVEYIEAKPDSPMNTIVAKPSSSSE